MSLLNTLLTALRGVTANKLRAILTTLGIIIGVASVIAMLALGNGARAAVEAKFRFLGADQVQISGMMRFDDGELTAAGKTLSYDDGLRMPDAVELVDQVDMSVGGNGKVRYGRATLDLSLSGVTASALANLITSKQVQPVKRSDTDTALTSESFLSQGRFFTPNEVLEGAAVCVLGYKTALDLFGGDNPIGETVLVNRQRFLVVGVLAELESTDESQRYSSDYNKTFYLPISSAIQMLYKDEPAVSITAHVTDESRMDEAKSQIASYLRERHKVEKNAAGNYQDDFNLTTRKDVLGAQQESARTFSLLLAAMATVSLAVGGIGIMNVMLVSVTERTREIGVRMAIGARTFDIVIQFLLEALLISAGGGVLGIVLGVLAIPLAASLNQGMALLAPDSIPVAFAVALLTGIVFGLYPAIRAARLDPVDALRYE